MLFCVAKDGMRLFAPTLDGKLGHYKSFLQTCNADKHEFGGTGQPSVEEKNFGSCSICPSYNFKSITAKQRDKSMFHRRPKGKKQTNIPSHTCNICEASFQSLSQESRRAYQTSDGPRKNKKNEETSWQQTS